eukprot:TRINITY_DN74926_c0_g1_i1.p1 TRINITY_DN74926_c0_g1~~TRINITY_DN74926_c0_g1_i1.p1  ORF type:complete len:459 (+),score=86.60 TRINITY_DN74926_c0_g1_i1:54-1430(+)
MAEFLSGYPDASAETGDEVLTLENVASEVREAVQEQQVIDVHTHLLPPTHGLMMLWGIDELLTYHYLISEYFMVAPGDMTHEKFFAMSKQEQAAHVWKGLFVDRSPISEACMGVLTTLKKLDLSHLVESRDLLAIREWFAAQDPAQHCERIFSLARVKYAVMTNIPFVEAESEHWTCTPAKEVTPRMRTALRIDLFMKGDWAGISKALESAGLEQNVNGAKQFLRNWADILKPEYLMASVPGDWHYPELPSNGVASLPADVPEDPSKIMKNAYRKITATTLIEEVVVPICVELKLPIALKLGALRGMSPELDPCCGGDGVVHSDIGSLQRLCARFPNVKFLATVLSRPNQHEMTVVTQKTRNLHLYGCWWYCNNPSIIEELTKMRVELLGTAFTAQHSDCRVLEQLLYKWEHSREVIGNALVPYYERLVRVGWKLTRKELQRDVEQLLGGSYEGFMSR